MIYLIDHEDSFTFNLAHLLGLYDKVIVSNFYLSCLLIIKFPSLDSLKN